MKPIFALIASPAIITPSITECGSCSKISLSLHVPGSLSSPFTSTYFGLSDCFGTNDHFIPVGKPAPPRPRRLEAFISAITQSAPFSSAWRADWYPSSSRYLSIAVAPLPKRLESTGTTSGWETRYAIFELLLSFQWRVGPVLLEHLVEFVRRQILIEVVVHLCGWAPTAGSNALHLFQRKQPVRRGLLILNSQLLLAMGEDLVRTPQHAADIRAHLHVIFPHGMHAQQRVVARHIPHIQFRDAHPRRHFCDYFF